MCIVAICSASSCSAPEVARGVADRLACDLVSSDQLLAKAAAASGIPVERFGRALLGSRSVFHRLTREKERCEATLRRTLATMVNTDDLVIESFATHLLPSSLTQVLRVGLAAPMEYRVAQLTGAEEISDSAAEERLRADDEKQARWTQELIGAPVWTKDLYDIFLPMDGVTVTDAVDMICSGAAAPALASSDATREAAGEFLVAADVHCALAEAGKGQGLQVSAAAGQVVVTINRYVMWLDRFEREIRKIAGSVEGVREVQTRIGPRFQRPNIYPGLDDVPQKILLVDDEVEFVQTLSERLLSRELESAVAYDGPQALAIAESDAPDVIVLDIKMPGMDGMEVLSELKKKHPKVQVIILTAHGSDEGARRAREEGAFAYLRKPANIDQLVQLMKDAYAAAKEDPADPAALEVSEDDAAGADGSEEAEGS